MKKALRLHAHERTGEPWPEHYVAARKSSKANLTDLGLIMDESRDEKPLQEFLASTPSLLRALVPFTRHFWAFDRPILGGELIPDFLIAFRNSSGFNWAYVELESPRVAALNRAGRISGKLNEALGQVRDWRVWLRQNIAYAQGHLGLRDIDAECPAWVIIGRRSMLEPKHAAKYRELSRSDVTVMTYDRLFDSIVDGSVH